MKFSTFEMVFKIIGFQVTDQSPTGETLRLPVPGFCFAMEDVAIKPSCRTGQPFTVQEGPPELLTVHILKRRTGTGGGLLGVEVSAIFAAALFLFAILNLNNLSPPRGLTLVSTSAMSSNPTFAFCSFFRNSAEI